jgi:hypothetical protein
MSVRLRLCALSLALGAASIGAGCRSEVAAPSSTVDTQPPEFVWVIGHDAPVDPGDFVTVEFYAWDNRGIAQVIVQVTGAYELRDTYNVPRIPTEFSADVEVPVREGARLDIPAELMLIVVDKAGLADTAITSVRLHDTRDPGASLSFGALHPDGTIRTGETLELQVNAWDNQRLTYIGYSGPGLRDSVAATSIGDSHVFHLTVPGEWRITRPNLAVWARDASGHGYEISTPRVPVYDFTDRPTMRVPLLPQLYPQQALLDEKRNAVYLLRAGPGGHGELHGVNVVTGQLLPTIELPDGSSHFAFSSSGDSLLLALTSSKTLGVVALSQAGRPVTVVPLQYDGASNRIPRAVQASGDRVFVALGSDRDWGRLMEVNLATGAQTIRTDLDGGSNVALNPTLATLPDGRVYVGSEAPVLDARFLYSPTFDAFTPTTRFGFGSSNFYSASATGRFLMGATVYDAALDSVAHAPPWDWAGNFAVALSPDGGAVYQSTSYGYHKIRLSDGKLLEQVKLPTPIRFLIATADGARVIAISDSDVVMIDQQ